MNAKLSIVIFILLSFLNIGAISNEIISVQNSFNILEVNMDSISEFEENGVKFQYKTKNNIEKEIFRIREYLTENINGNYKEINKNQFQITNDYFKLNTKTWYEDKYTYVEITLINTNSQYTTANLKDMLQKLENEKIENIQYFLYYEGKQSEEDDNHIIDELIQKNNMKDIKFLDINNGHVGTGNLSNGDKINFALINYNTGSHIIIGTPIIFATY